MRALASGLGVLALVSVGLLLAWDVVPRLFPAGAHLVLGAVPLAAIALAYLAYQGVAARGSGSQLLRAGLLAAAFLFWAGNQLLGDGGLATLCNDVAIALFVVDVLLTMLGWPAEKGKPADNLPSFGLDTKQEE